MRTTIRVLLAGCVLLCATTAAAQKIRDRYVSRIEEDGTIYHTLPQTLFAHRQYGDLTFDITYKTRRPERRATVNFTCSLPGAAPVDSARFTAGEVAFGGPVEKLFVEPGKREWTHRYTLSTPVDPLFVFFDETAQPARVTLYRGGESAVYEAKRPAWRSFAPAGHKIFETIRYNEQ